jgi:hypothetical protein
VLALTGCGDLDLQRRAGPARDADDPWDDPWGVAETDAEDADPSHAGRLMACQDAAHAQRPSAREDEARAVLERERLACSIAVNDDAFAWLRREHPDAGRVDRGADEHRDFAARVCELIAAARQQPVAHLWATCMADMELALGHVLGAHGGLDGETVALARQPWLYPCAESSDGEDLVTCIEDAVTQRLHRIARELDQIGVASSEDLAILDRPRAVADVTCAAMPPQTREIWCPADWLLLGRDVIDRHLQW